MGILVDTSVLGRLANRTDISHAAAQASAVAAAFEATFPMLDETPAVYPAWRTLVESVEVVGKQVHDARLVAVCQVHGVKGVLTFNVAHFARLASPETGIEVLDLMDVARSDPR